MFILFSLRIAGVYKEESSEDPYSFVDEESGANRSAPAPPVDPIKAEPNPIAPVPKKRGRKKKVLPEPGYSFYFDTRRVDFDFMLVTFFLLKKSGTLSLR